MAERRAPRLILEADVIAWGRGPIVIARGELITPSALDRARLLGITVRFAVDATPAIGAAPCDGKRAATNSSEASKKPDVGCGCESTGAHPNPPEIRPEIRRSDRGATVPRAGASAVPAPGYGGGGSSSPSVAWSLNFHRRGIDPELFRVRRRSPRAGVPAETVPAGATSDASRPTVPLFPRARADSTSSWVVSVSGPAAPGRLVDALGVVERLGTIKDLRHRSVAGIFQLVAVVESNGGGAAAEVADRLERSGLTALIHPA